MKTVQPTCTFKKRCIATNKIQLFLAYYLTKKKICNLATAILILFQFFFFQKIISINVNCIWALESNDQIQLTFS